MKITIRRWFQVFLFNITFGCLCRGLIILAPTNVPWATEQWTLQCYVNPLTTVVTITNPGGTQAGTCQPASGGFPASCTQSTGNTLAINETANTISMTRTIADSDTGTWTCEHLSESEPYTLSSPLPNRTTPDSSSSNERHSMTATAGSELTSDTEHTFYFHYGCVSANLKFIWTTVPGSSWSDTSNTNSNSFACTTNLAYMSELATSAAILKSVSSKGTQLKVSVYVDGYDNLAVAEYTYNVTFAPGLKSATPSNEMTVEIGSSFLEVTGTIRISDIIPSFESTVFLFQPTTSINTNYLSLEDSNSKSVISILLSSTSESLEPTELPNSENIKTEMEVSSSLFSLERFNFSDKTIISHSDISISITTNLPISSASDLERNTEISLQDDSTQSQNHFSTTSGIYIDTQTHVTSFLDSVLMYTKSSNVQTDLSPSTLTTYHDSINTLSLQPSSDIFMISLYNQDSSADMFSLRIVTSPAGPIMSVETYSYNQTNTSVESWSVSQTEFGLVNTSTVDAFTSYDNSASVLKIASSSGDTTEVQLLPISTKSFGQNHASVGSFAPVDELSITLFSYFSSLSKGQSVHTSTSQMTVFDSYSVSRTVKSSNESVEQIMSSYERSMINSLISFADTLTFKLNDLSTSESTTSIITSSLNLPFSHNQVVFSSDTLGNSQFPPFTDMSSSYQPALIVASSVNHITHSSSSQSRNATNVSIVSSATSMQVLSLDTFKFRQTGESMHLSTYRSIPFVDSATSKQPDSTPFVSSQIQLINTPLLTSVPFFLDTSSLGQLAPSTGLPVETSSVSVNFGTERMSTTIYDLSLLSPSAMLQVSSLTDIIKFSEILSLSSVNQVTSVMNSIEPSDTVYVFSSPPTSINTQAPELSFTEAQIIILSCSIALVILVVFIPLMVMYCLGKLSRSKKPEKDSLSSVNVPHVFNLDFFRDNPNMGKTLPVRYHSRVLLDLPYSRNFENNWNSLTS